jgi:CBS domain-containing protein
MNTPIALLLSRKGSSVYSVASSATVAEAVHVMNLHKVGSLIVLQAGKLAGIFTERDVLTRVVAAGLMPTNTSVADVMTPRPITVSPHATIEEVMEIFSDRRCRHLPVIDDTGSLVGMISMGDITRWLVDAHRMEADHLRQYIAGGVT